MKKKLLILNMYIRQYRKKMLLDQLAFQLSISWIIVALPLNIYICKAQEWSHEYAFLEMTLSTLTHPSLRGWDDDVILLSKSFLESIPNLYNNNLIIIYSEYKCIKWLKYLYRVSCVCVYSFFLFIFQLKFLSIVICIVRNYYYFICCYC